MKHALCIWIVTCCIAFVPGSANAGHNAGATARLSWSLDRHIPNLDTPPASPTPLFLILGSAHDIRSIAVTLIWCPDDTMAGGYTIVSGGFPTPFGTSVDTPPTGGFAGDTSYTASIVFPTDDTLKSAVAYYVSGGTHAPAPAAIFALSQVLVMDGTGAVDTLAVAGYATIGGNYSDLLPLSIESLSPIAVRPGTTANITVTGTAFPPDGQVRVSDGINTYLAQEVAVESPQQLTARINVPEAVSRPLDVSFQAMNGQKVTLPMRLGIAAPGDAGEQRAASQNGIPVCTALGDQLITSLASDGTGGVFVAWDDFREGPANPDVYVQHLTGMGNVVAGWPSDGLAIATGASDQSGAKLVRDGQGGTYVIWGGDDVYALRIDGSGVVASGWPPTGIALCTASSRQTTAACISDGSGGAIAAWIDRRRFGTATYVDDLYAQRIRADGTLAPGWSTNGVPACILGLVSQVSAVPDGANGILLYWQDGRSLSTTNYDIYGLRITSAGALSSGWTENGIPICNATHSQESPRSVSDGDRGALLGWNDLRNSSAYDFDIYGLRVNEFHGWTVPGWVANGESINSSAGSQQNVEVAPDGAGGIVFVWQDRRSGSFQLYAQRYDASGSRVTGWTASGVPLCSVVGDQQLPMAIAGAGGATLVAWVDDRNTLDSNNNDVYATSIGGGGTIDAGWPTSGLELCTADGNQWGVVVAEDDGGGAFVGWRDYRTGVADVYLQHVYSSGGLAAVDGAPARSEALRLTIGPNPVHALCTIDLEVATKQSVSLEIIDVQGRIVRRIASRLELSEGSHRLYWDGRTTAGRRVANGVYFVRVVAGDAKVVKKLVICE